MVMVQELYTLITQTPFCLPIDPGPNAIYVQAINLNNPNAVPDAAPLSRTEQATINMTFTHPVDGKHQMGLLHGRQCMHQRCF
jgi:hypothetical protein